MFFLIIFTLFFFKSTINCQQSVFLETEDGWKIHLRYTKPKKESYPFLMLIHSQKENYTEWKSWFKAIESFGYGWAAVDLRGHGVSIYKTDGSSQTYQSFSVSGNDNEYNKMIRDVEEAVIFLSSDGIKEDRIFIVASNLGANIAAKFCVINQKLAGAVLINPYTTINDIPIIGLLRNFGERPLLIVSSEKNIKRIRDSMLIYYLSKSKNKSDRTFLIISGNFDSVRNAPQSLIYRILHWINIPVIPQTVDLSSQTFNTTITTDSVKSSTSPIYLILDEE